MATEINQADFEVVGQGINEVPDPTKVPRAGQASKEAVNQMQAETQPLQAQMQAPAQAPALPQEDFEPLDQGDFEQLEEYADGSTPAFAINQSPLSFVDRLALASGNAPGNLKYLKDNFEDVMTMPNGSIRVKKEGSWYHVDPSGLGSGDAWERTKELTKDIADRVWSAAQGAGAGVQVGGPMGAAVGALAGTIGPDAIEALIATLPETDDGIKKALGVAGVSVASPVLINALRELKRNPALLKGVAKGGLIGGGIETVRTSLGRLVGTYEATPEEQLKDIANESLFGLGNVLIPAGVKPTMQHVKTALSNIEKGASNYAKELISATTATLNGQPRWAIRRAMDASKPIMTEAEAALKALGPGKSPLDAAGILSAKQAQLAKSMVNDADRALKARYRANLGNLLKDVPDDYVMDVRDAARSAMGDLAEAGLGTIDEAGKFRVLSDREIAKFAQSPESQLPAILGPKTADAVRQIGEILNKYQQLGALTGKNGAKKAIDLRKALRESFDEISGGNEVADRIKAIVGNVETSMGNRIGQSFADKGVGTQFSKMNNEYTSHINAVKLLKEAVNSKNPNEIDNLVKKLVSKSGSNQSLKEEAFSLADLVGHDRTQRILDMEAAKAFLDFVPKASVGSDMITSVAKATLGTTVASPRALGREIEMGHRFLDFIKNGVRKGYNVASDDAVLTSLYQTIGQASSSQDAETRRLLQEAGIDPSALDRQGR